MNRFKVLLCHSGSWLPPSNVLRCLCDKLQRLILVGPVLTASPFFLEFAKPRLWWKKTPLKIKVCHLKRDHFKRFSGDMLVFGGVLFTWFYLRKKFMDCFFFGSVFHQLMARWFGARWFGIRIGIPLTNNPFHKGIPEIQTTNPNDPFTIRWFQMRFTGGLGCLFWTLHRGAVYPSAVLRQGRTRPTCGRSTEGREWNSRWSGGFGKYHSGCAGKGWETQGLAQRSLLFSPGMCLFLFFLLVKIFFGEQTLDWDTGFLQVWFQGLRITIWTLNIDTPFLPSKNKAVKKFPIRCIIFQEIVSFPTIGKMFFASFSETLLPKAHYFHIFVLPCENLVGRHTWNSCQAWVFRPQRRCWNGPHDDWQARVAGRGAPQDHYTNYSIDQPVGWYCWWKAPVDMVGSSSQNYMGFLIYIPGGLALGFLKHQSSMTGDFWGKRISLGRRIVRFLWGFWRCLLLRL